MPYLYILLASVVISTSGAVYSATYEDYAISPTLLGSVVYELDETKDIAPPAVAASTESEDIEDIPLPLSTESPIMVIMDDDSSITPTRTTGTGNVVDVPFYSQFKDVSDPSWQKVSCGIASLAMIIELYHPGSVSVDRLLSEGIASGAFLDGAGWIHRGLVNLAKDYNLNGESFDYAHSNMTNAYTKLENALESGPVIASVHYTFEPTNPIPHLVVINGVDGETIYYNDPSEEAGGGTISVEKFKKAWKKRFIEILPS